MNAPSYSSLLAVELRKLPKIPVTSFGAEDLSERCRERRHEIARKVLGFSARAPVVGETVGRLEREHYTVEKLVIRAEEGSWITALLYLPRNSTGKLPLVLMAPGHGGSKSHGYMPVGGQIYAQLGFAAFVADPIGEEERHWPCGVGARGHREHHAVDRLNRAGRPFLGKVVYDLIASLDYLQQRPDLDPERMACVGSSMGGTVAQLLGALEPRLRATLVSSWAADYHFLSGHYGCCFRLPGLIHYANQIDLLAMAIPHAKVLVCSGSDDEVTPPQGLREMVAPLETWANGIGREGCFECRIEEGGGHRPYYLMKYGVEWLFDALALPSPPGWNDLGLRTLGSLLSAAGHSIAPLYDQERHHRGTLIPDLPVELLPPADLGVLSPGVMERLGLARHDFTLEGFLERLGTPALDQIHPLPDELSPADATLRLERSLGEWLTESDWFHVGDVEQESEEHLAELTLEKWRFAGVKIGFTVARSVHATFRTKEVALLLTRNREPWKTMPYNFKRQLVVVPELLQYDDNEMLLGTSALMLNCSLLSHLFAHFGRRGITITHLISDVPRLGELLFWREGSLRHFHLLAESAVEEAPVGNGRVESILSGTPDLHWIDLFLARTEGEMVLPMCYFTPKAWQQLNRVRADLQSRP